MPAWSRPSFDVAETVVLRWAMKAFLLGLFLWAAAAMGALVSS